MTTLAHIADNTSTDEATVVSNSGWGTNTRGLISVASAYSSAATVTHTATGGGVTWTVAVTIATWAGRRGITMFESDGTPDDTDITITASGSAGTFQEKMYSIDEVASWDGTTLVLSTAFATATSSPISVSLGTIVDDQITYAACGEENASSSLAGDTGTDMHTVIDGGANVRMFLAIDGGGDNGPGFTWTGSGDAGQVGARLSDGSTGSHVGAAGPRGPLGHPLHGPFAGPIG